MREENSLQAETPPENEAQVDHVRRKITAGMKAADEGRVVPHEEVKKRFLSGTGFPIPCR
jgi:predicted transcriptional regulator